MPLGAILLFIVAVLIYLGLAHRVLDRLYLTDRGALLLIAAMLVGSYLPDIPLSRDLFINIGGGIIPVVLVGYLFYAAGTGMEKTRGAIALIVAALVVYGMLRLVPLEPTYAMVMDPLYMVAIIAGVVGYLAGRSRRSAFIAGVGAVVLNDIFTRLELLLGGIREPLVIGGAGIFDATVIAGLIALFLAEVVGEAREKMHRQGEESFPGAGENTAGVFSQEDGPGEFPQNQEEGGSEHHEE